MLVNLYGEYVREDCFAIIGVQSSAELPSEEGSDCLVNADKFNLPCGFLKDQCKTDSPVNIFSARILPGDHL